MFDKQENICNNYKSITMKKNTKTILTKIYKYVKKPSRLFIKMGDNYLLNWIPDEIYLRIRYKIMTGERLNLNNPVTFNEKLQWLKLYDRNPLYTELVDKYEVKKYISEMIGEEYIIPTIGVWNTFDEIDFNDLPDQFVLKCTHDSGGLVIVSNRSEFDQLQAKKKLEKRLRRNFYWSAREWPYKNVKPRIIAEEYLEEKGHKVPEDYKIYCINGKPKYIRVVHNRFDDRKPKCETVYDTKWIPQNISLDNRFLISNEVSEKPNCLDTLLNIAEKLCQGYTQIRLDFYIIDSHIYFGEITFYPASGFQSMCPKEMDRVLGEELKLPYELSVESYTN